MRPRARRGGSYNDNPGPRPVERALLVDVAGRFLGRLFVAESDDPTDTPRTTVLIVTHECLRFEALFRQSRVLFRQDILSLELEPGMVLARLLISPIDRYAQSLSFRLPRWRRVGLTNALALRSWL